MDSAISPSVSSSRGFSCKTPALFTRDVKATSGFVYAIDSGVNRRRRIQVDTHGSRIEADEAK